MIRSSLSFSVSPWTLQITLHTFGVSVISTPAPLSSTFAFLAHFVFFLSVFQVAWTNHSFTWDKDAFSLCCFSGVFDSSDGEVPRETSGFGGHVVCFGLKLISVLGSFFAAESSGNSGLDLLRGGAYILTAGQSLFVLDGFFQVISRKRMWTREPSCVRSITATPTATCYTSSTSKPYPCTS